MTNMGEPSDIVTRECHIRPNRARARLVACRLSLLDSRKYRREMLLKGVVRP